MALEALLPSEVARLVYGYLIDEKCVETAKTFLNESPSLQECRNVLSRGRHFTTRMCGYTLLDILEKFCIISSIVQKKVDKFDNADKLKHYTDLVNQIKFLVDVYRGQQFIINDNTSIQNQCAVRKEALIKSYRRCSSSSKDEDKLKQIRKGSDKELRTQIQTTFNSNSVVVETTLLQNLPGYIKDLQTEKYQMPRLKSHKKLKENSKIGNILQHKEFDRNIILQEIKNENQCLPNQRYNTVNTNVTTTIEKNLKKDTNSEVQISERCCSGLEKNTMINSTNEKLRNDKNSEVDFLNIGSSGSELSPTNECTELLSDLTLELLSCTEVQEKIANNINRILEPIKSNLYVRSNEEAKEELNKSFMVEFNKAIEVAVNKTENDPEFLKLLDEIIPESEESLSAEDEVEVNNENSINKFKEKIEKNIFENNIHKEVTELKKTSQSTFHVLDVRNINKITNTEQVDLSKGDKCSIKPTVIKQVDLTKKNCKFQTNDRQNNLMSNTIISLNPLESPILQQKAVNRSNNIFCFNNTTSTPIKTCKPIQNLDTYEWLSTQDILKPKVVYHVENIDIPTKTNTYTASETIMTSVASNLSPIISKETTEIAERITAISYLTTNTVKGHNQDQTLETPNISSTKIKVSNNVPPTFPINIMPKCKTSFVQKSSEVIDELLNLQKSNGNVDNLSPFLKDSNEYNRYFSIESIMLYGMDNNISTVKTPLTVPEIEIEDSITLTGTGLSPFLKVYKKSDAVNNVTKDKDNEIIKSVISKKFNESEIVVKKNDNQLEKTLINNKSGNSETIIEKNDKELLTNTSQIITKHTPKELLENQSKINRLSLSTPKKSSNYVRALNFNTPVNKSYSESKMKDKQHCLSPETIKKNLKTSCKSSLFQSPPFTNSHIIEQKQCSNTFQNVVLGIKHLKPINEMDYKMDVVNKNKKKSSNKISNEKSFLKKSTNEKSINTNKVNDRNKSWDSDLRKYLGQYEIENKNELQQRNHKKKIKEVVDKKVASKRKKKNEKLLKVQKSEKIPAPEKLEQNDIKTTKDLLDILSDSMNNDDIVNEESMLRLASEEMNKLTKISVNKNNNSDEKIQDEKSMIATFEVGAKNLPPKSLADKDFKPKKLNDMVNENSSEEKSLMNYKKIEEELNIIPNINIKNSCTKKIEVIYDRVNKVECGKIVQKKYARIKTLDKNITKSSFASKKNHSLLNDFVLDLETSQKDEYTLQIPPTPQIMSPGSSTLMMPISKLNEDSRTIQSLIATPLECPLTPKIVLTPPKTLNDLPKDYQKPKNSPYYQPTLKIFEASKKSEITQFEVIKENLLKDKNIKTQFDSKKIDNCTQKLDVSVLYREKKVTSKSDSSSTFSTSSCTCNSCLLSLSSGNEGKISDVPEDMQNTDNEDKKFIKGTNVQNRVQAASMKLLLINKSDKEIEEWAKEIPTKNENLCTEVKIFETPIISKVTENPMKLNTKISHMIILKEEETKKEQNSNVKIISIDRMLPKIVTKSPIELLKALQMKNKTNASASIQTIKIEKNEEEIAKAVESIMTDEGKKINNEINKTSKSIVFDSLSEGNGKSNINKVELVKAVESITKSDYEKQQYTHLDATNSNDESNRETNLKFVLEDESTLFETLSIESNKTKQRSIQNNNGSAHQHNTRFKSRQMLVDEKNISLSENNDLSNCNASCQEIQYVFEEDNYKRKRRKAFSDTELTWEFHDEFGGLMNATAPTALDIIFKINPARKKSSKKVKSSKRSQTIYAENITQDSISSNSNNNIPLSNAKSDTDDEKDNGINNKRKRTIGEIEYISNNKKRRKNIFIL